MAEFFDMIGGLVLAFLGRFPVIQDPICDRPQPCAVLLRRLFDRVFISCQVELYDLIVIHGLPPPCVFRLSPYTAPFLCRRLHVFQNDA